MEKSHSIMFHHFHNEKHFKAQGSIGQKDFIEILDWLSEKYSILNASEYIKKFLGGELNDSDICLSFDDGLLSQYDIVFPVLKKRNISAFFFVYSSIFTENPAPLEIYRFFRTVNYKNINNFYEEFFEIVYKSHTERYHKAEKTFEKLSYLSEYEFYSKSDRWFRYLRDIFLGDLEYNKIMKTLMKMKNFNIEKAKENLWINEKQLLDLEYNGNIIGLHSHSHPTKMSQMSFDEQFSEYSKNLSYFEKLFGKDVIKSMSHPCGDYNEMTLEILKKLNIKVGFRSNMIVKNIKTPLEIPREDHATIYAQMKYENNNI